MMDLPDLWNRGRFVNFMQLATQSYYDGLYSLHVNNSPYFIHICLLCGMRERMVGVSTNGMIKIFKI